MSKRKGRRPPKPEGAVQRQSTKRASRSKNDVASLAEWMGPAFAPLQEKGIAFMQPGTDATTLVITVTELISYILQSLIILHAGRAPSTANLDKVFKVNGPLASLSSRIDLCFLMGHLTPDMKYDLDIMRKIRNDFCHSVAARSFDDADIKIQCEKLKIQNAATKEMQPSLIAIFKDQKPLARQQYVAATAGLFMYLMAMIMKRVAEVETLSSHRVEFFRLMRQKAREHLSFMMIVPDEEPTPPADADPVAGIA